MRVEVNGKLVDVPEGATYGDLKRAAGLERSDSVVRVQQGRAELQHDDSVVSDSGKFRSVPPLVQG